MVLCVFLSYYCFAEYSFRQASDYDSAIFAYKAWSFTPIIISVLLHFILVYTQTWNKRRTLLATTLVYLPGLLFSILYLSTDLLTGELSRAYWGWTATGNSSPASISLLIWIATSYGFSLFLCIRYLLHAADFRTRQQAIYIFIAILIPVVAHILSSEAAPVLLRIPIPGLLAPACLIMAVIIGFAIRQYGLFSISLANVTQSILPTIPDILILLDPGKKIKMINKSTLTSLGYREDELIGNTPEAIFENGKYHGLGDKILKGRLDIEVNLVTKTGIKVPVSLSTATVNSPIGETLGTVLIARDISKRNEIQEKLQDTNDYLESLIKHIPDVIYSAAPDTTATKTFVSDRWCQWTGYSKSQIAENPELWAKSIHVADRARVLTAYAEATRTGTAYVCYYRLLHNATGKIRYVVDRGIPVKNKRGVILRFDGILSDITRQREAEEILRQSEANYRTVVESSPDGVLVLDNEGYVIDCNQSMCDLLALTQKEILQKHFDNLVSLMNSKIFDSLYSRIHEGESWGDELQFAFGRGQVISLWAKGVALVDQQQNVSGSIIYFRDITERKKMDQLKDEFIALISHELRSPLTVVMGVVNTALSDAENMSKEEMHRLLLDAAWETESLSHLLDNLVELFGAQTDRLNLHLEVTSLKHIVEDAIRKVRRQYPDHIFQINIPGDTPLIYSDQLRLERVLYNLLENAAKYSPPDTLIKTYAETHGNFLHVGITDRGKGISRRSLTKLFQPFERLEKLSQEQIKGAGLGLVVCQRLLEAHGGRIWATSEHGRGSTFQFTLPIVVGEDDTDYQ